MIGQTIGHYRILARIGGGGMGVVYRAEDLRLGRRVALKLLPPDLAPSPEARERFRREAELISSLNHPHICTLHDVGDHEGRRFLVFELVDGRTLKEAIDGAPLPVEHVVALAIDLADALAAAHARGIVHRDVKPGNIMLTSRGDAKLLDFGIAKREWRSATDDEATRADLTRQGEWVGTPDYMAPEQARGEAMDARADLFALGAVMYEMATGRPPFRADTVAATIDAVLRRAPERPSALNPQVPDVLERVILKALEKDRALRYQTAREIVADLRRLSRDSSSSEAPSATASPSWMRRPVTAVAGIGVLLAAAVTSWLLLSGRQSEKPPPGPTDAGGSARLVVLPFENQTGQAADDWLAGAFSDAISAALQPVASIILVPRERVVELYEAESRRESQALSSELARQVSQRLRVRYYVHGSYQKVGDDLRVVAKLVDVEADRTRAQESLTDRFANVLALEDALAASMAKGLGVAAGGSRIGQTADLEAQQWFSEARALYARSEWADARPLLQRAVAKDAKYAAAWALLSKTDSRLTSPAMAGRHTTSASLQSALDAALTAGTLAPDLTDAQIALALAYRGLVQMERMRTAAERAVALDPRSGEALIVLGDAYGISPGTGCRLDGQPEVAERNYRKALGVDPYVPSGYLNLVTFLWWMDRQDEAATVLEQGLAAAPQNPMLHASHPFNLIFANRLDEAEALITRMAAASMQGPDLATVAFAALKRRQFAEADAMLRRADDLKLFSSLPWTLITSVAQFQAGRPAEGAKYLTRAVTSRPECGLWATSIPAFARYRDLPEFRQALGR